MSIARLPYWILTEKHPAFYDADSKTAVEMVSKVYGKMQELVDDYNKFVDEINKEIKLFEESTTNDQEAFEERITKVIHDYIDFLDSKVEAQDKIINDSIVYIKENLANSIADLTNQMKESGEFDEAVLNAINNVEARITTLEEDNENNKTKIQTLEIDNEDHNNRIENLEGDNASNKNRIQNLETNNANHENRLNLIETNFPNSEYISSSETIKFINVRGLN